jgi:hypothetical protein
MPRALLRTFFIVNNRNHSPFDAVGLSRIKCAAILCELNARQNRPITPCRPMETLCRKFSVHNRRKMGVGNTSIL